MPIKQHFTKHFTKGAAAVTLLKLFSHMPMNMTQRVGTGIGHMMWASRGRARYVAETNIKACFPDHSPAQQKRLAKQAILETGKTIAETGALWNSPFEFGRKLLHHIHNEALLDDALASERGLILILPHLGNWELTNHYISTKTNILAMYQPAKIPELDRLMHEARNRHGTKTVPTTASGVKAVYRHLKKGGTTVILADQEPPLKSGRFASFFNRPALTPTLVPRLLKDTHAHALMIFTIRTEQRAQFDVHILPVEEALFSHNLEEAAVGLNRSIEQCVNKAIPQYQWSYKRFKQRPDKDTPPLYKR